MKLITQILLRNVPIWIFIWFLPDVIPMPATIFFSIVGIVVVLQYWMNMTVNYEKYLQ